MVWFASLEDSFCRLFPRKWLNLKDIFNLLIRKRKKTTFSRLVALSFFAPTCSLGYDATSYMNQLAPTVSSFRRKIAIFFVAGSLALFGGQGRANELPQLGQDAASIISPYEERQIGEEAMVQIRHSLDFVDDAELTYYLQQLGTRLTSHLAYRPHEFQFFLIAHPEINAFAIPGGFVGVHTGLITKARNESEVAAVLAHEISHVTQRHWPRMVAAQKDRAGATMAAILASIVIAGSGNPNGAGVAMAAMAANTDSQLAFTRSFEREADRIGIQLLADSDYDVTAMASFFERLGAESGYSGANLPEFVRTHPVTTDRIAEARNNEKRFKHLHLKPSVEFVHLRARINALFQGDPSNAVKLFQAEIKNNASTLETRAARYGLGIALMNLGDFAAARKEIDTLRQQYPDFLQYQVLEADLDLAAGKTQDGLRAYDHIYKNHSSTTWVVQHYAEMLVANKQPRTALKVLKPALRSHPKNPALNKLMASASGDTGDLVQAHRSMAEYYFLNGNRHAAIEQLEIAERNAGKDYYALSAIKARKNEIKQGLAPATKP